MASNPSGLPFEGLPSAYFEAVGKAATAFGMVEDGLEGLFNVTLKSAVPFAAKAILNAGTFDTRTKLAKILAELTLETDLLAQALELIRRARAIGHRRNSLVHGRLWNLGSIDEGIITQSTQFMSGNNKVALADIRTFSIDCMNLFEELSSLAVSILSQSNIAAARARES